MASDPKQPLEQALYALLDGAAAILWPVFNTVAAGESFAYVLFSAAGGDDDHMKKRGYTYEYQVVGIHTDRSTALAMGAAVEGVLAGARASLAITGYNVIWAERLNPVDYTEELPDTTSVHHVGGIYQFMLREA